MKIIIDPVQYATNLADSIEEKDTKEWIELYDKTFNSLTDSSIDVTLKLPIKYLTAREFCKQLGISLSDFTEALYQLDLSIQKERITHYSENIFQFFNVYSEDGRKIDIAINSLHPCLIKMIFAYLHKLELIDKAFSIIREYGRD